MKPTFRIHFSGEHPDRPGLWVSRRSNFISVLQVDERDIEQDKRESNWLDGEWGAELELVDRDLVPLDRRKVQEHLDQLISHAHQNTQTVLRDALQTLRTSLLGSRLELPEITLGQEEPRPVAEKPESLPAAGND